MHSKTSSFEWRIRMSSPVEDRGDEEKGFRAAAPRRWAALWSRTFLVLLVCVAVYTCLRTSLYATGRKTTEALEIWLNAHLDTLGALEHVPPAPPAHPILNLITDAQTRFAHKVARQSRTLPLAVAEYERRYGRPPPKGFDRWWEFAQEREFVMTDEFDVLNEDLKPFWNISGSELQTRARLAGMLPSVDVVTIRDGKWYHEPKTGFKDSEQGARAHGFRVILEQFAHELPDMSFPVNAKAEGMILVPQWRRQENANVDAHALGIDEKFNPAWANDGNVWEWWRRTCEPTDPARQLYTEVPNSNSSLNASELAFTFASESPSRVDFCADPSAHLQQGLFFSDWRTIPAQLPIFSPAHAPGFGDIRIPSHYYYGGTRDYTYAWDPVRLRENETDAMEVPWENKTDKLFWRGSTTGGGSTPRGYVAGYQRHRFVRLASDASDEARELTFANGHGGWTTAPVPVGALNNELMDAAFTHATNPKAYPGGLDALQRDHRFADKVPLGDHWAHKYLVDIDGQSYSGRFMAFLASDSVPVKATVYGEFFSDWIEPWVHFIPLSAGYDEIYNIHSFFSGPPQAALDAVNATAPPEVESHDDMLQDIAKAGKRWKNTIGRKADMEVYVYRLCLEYARLWSTDRESMDFAL